MKKTNDQEYLSVRQISEQGLFPWLKSYHSVRRWILKDLNGKNKLGTTVIDGKNTGVRYYIKKQKVLDYVKAFQNNKL